ncbi:MAG TPA: hypothetical protein VN623_11555, partial [Hyphomicrobium sp.]|uniref:hypothetical protein n=1 Tax=Hyphomicrobium sp. TaxID=82 RepID=UPI002C3C039A
VQAALLAKACRENGVQMIEDDKDRAERRCANCLSRVLQTRLDGDEDECCGERCAADWHDWWTKAKSVQEVIS